MEGDPIDLEVRRKERWQRQLEEARAAGRAAIFGVIGETEAQIIQFPDKTIDT